MTTGKLTEFTQLTVQELKRLAAAKGPCITILQPLMPAPNEARQNHARVKAAVQEAERVLAERHMDSKQTRDLLAPLLALPEELDFNGESAGLVILRAPEVFHHFGAKERVKESVTVSNHFFVRPLLPLLDADRTFYILALSQKHIRLLRCTGHSSEEVTLPASVPTNLYENIQTEEPDHDENNRSAGGPSTGSMKGVVFTTSTDRESRDGYLHQFYKDVDRGIHQLLRDDRSPLVLAGVEYESALYRRINSYPHLAEDAVQGAPDGLKGGDLHRRALEPARSYFEADLKKALAMFDELNGTPRTAHSLKDVIECAYDGRVLYLLVSENAQYFGTFDEATRVAQSHKNPLPGDEDLLNAAAVQTILHAGQVFVLPPGRMPSGAPAIAVLRY